MRCSAYAFVGSCLLIASPAMSQDVYEGAGATSDLDCDGGVATIRGASNEITVTGRCTQLVIEGASNRVTVELASKGIVRVVGADNQVVWTTPDGSKAQLRIAGAGNRVSKAR